MDVWFERFISLFMLLHMHVLGIMQNLQKMLVFMNDKHATHSVVWPAVPKFPFDGGNRSKVDTDLEVFPDAKLAAGMNELMAQTVEEKKHKGKEAGQRDFVAQWASPATPRHGSERVCHAAWRRHFWPTKFLIRRQRKSRRRR